ncbi:HalOD1 output domain-containing protein [Halalkalirubrum salinum]|uniref:HalOD1 output domain-containing protein n=1 Tax=Halalkalirubrum salinum TaxID=2563889 RepID=UPI0010FB164D|nr:HalOD1 output domain-containing protein [Halalkalirubrum salinum]
MTSSLILTDSTDRFGYDPITETYHAQHDWTSDSPLSITVVGVVAAVIGEEPMEMEPLYAVTDPDALDTLLSSGTEAGIQVAFEYEEQSVTVTGHGEIVVG